MSVVEFVHNLIENGDGKWNEVRLEAENEEAMQVKLDLFISKGYAKSSEEAYNTQIAEAEAGDSEPAADVPSEDGQVSEEAPAEEVVA